MSERYSIVKHEKRLFYLKQCPIILVSHAITKDNVQDTVFLQCKFENLIKKQLKPYI